MNVLSRAEWGAAEPKPGCIENRDPHTVTTAVVHYSDALGPDAVGPPDQPDEHAAVQQVRAIQRFHMGERGWCDIAYHRLIAPDGTVFEGRSLGQVGAHCAGHNAESVGYCLLTDGPVTDAQKASLLELLQADRAPLGAPYSKVGPHRAFTATACPGDTIAEWVDGGLAAPDTSLPETGRPPTTCADLPPGPPPAGRPLLQLGARGGEVAELQRLLADRGHPPDHSQRGDGSWDGVFGAGTEAAVASLQHAAGLTVDGKAGRQVYCALGIT